MSASSPAFEPYCPSGGTWYACGNGTKFTGCCTEYPCTLNGCFAGNLRPASFRNLTAYGHFPDQVCEAGQWYTCTGTSPSFLGCCSSSACQQNGCPIVDLQAGYLSSNTQIALAFDPQPPLPGTDTSTPTPNATAATMSSSEVVATTSAINVAPSAQGTLSSSRSQSVGTIAGATVGGVLVILVIVLGVFFLLRQHRYRNRSQTSPSQALEKQWLTPHQSVYSPYLDDTRRLPLYMAGSGSTTSPAELPTSANSRRHSPCSRQRIYEAGAHQINHFAYSPLRMTQASPSLISEGFSVDDSHPNSGLKVRGVDGNDACSRAEVD